MHVLVTGNGSGIGRAIDLELRRAGHDLIGTHAPCFGQPNNMRRDWDIADEYQNKEVMAHIDNLDVLVNNAGILDEEEFGDLTAEGIGRIFRTNFVAPLLLSQEAVKRGAKLIINIGSMYGVTGAYGRKPTYAASKAALHNATRSLARALAPAVRVVGVAPGIIPTGIHDNQGGIDKHGTGHSLLGRVGTVEDVARTVRFLIEDGQYINGTVVEVSGGR